MKKVRRINRKPAPAEKLPYDSDSDEEQPIKQGKGKNALKIPKPRDQLDSKAMPRIKRKLISKKVSDTRKEDLKEDLSDDADSKVLPRIKKKLNSKKVSEKKEGPKEELSDDADSKVKPRIKRKINSKKVSGTKREDPKEDLSDDTDSIVVPRIKKKLTRKKVERKEDLREEASDHSDSDEKPQIRKTKKNSTAADTRELRKHSLNHLDSDENPSHPLKAKGKGKGKKSKETPEPDENTAPSDNLLQRKAKPEDGELSSDEDLDYDAPFNPKSHEHSLQRLKSIDPQFYKFLEEHDAELLNFDAEESPLEEEENDGSSEKDTDDTKLHAPGALVEFSDESDYEMENDAQGKVTLKMVNELTLQLRTPGKPKAGTIIYAAKLFHAAVQRATSEDGTCKGEFVVAGSSVFNSILSMCILNMPRSVASYLGMEDSAVNPTTCKRFVKLKATMIQYIEDTIKLLSVVTSDSILSMMLKHLHRMSSFAACFPRLAKKAIKKILPLWATAEETVRVLAFMCILRISVCNLSQLLEKVLKAMHLTYVRNCKFVSPTTWPGINFMRRSLCEMYMLNLDVSYAHAFLYIRQLGIHLRNAIMVPKLEHKLAVYNWQYLNSLRLWAELIQQKASYHSGLNSLFFPLTMVISNTINLVPTPQYYPVRFFLTEVLMDMTKESGIFVPVKGYLMDVLTKFKFNEGHNVSMKPMDLSCVIRLSKSQMSENAFKKAVVERVYALLLEYLATISSSSVFPEQMSYLCSELNRLSRSADPNTAKIFKQLRDKVMESAEFMRKERFSCRFMFNDPKALGIWEANIRKKSTPLMTYFENWRRTHQTHKRKVFDRLDEIYGDQRPPIERAMAVMKEGKKVFYKEPVLEHLDILPSDSDDDKDYFQNKGIEKAPPKEKNNKKKANKKPKKTEEDIPDAADTGDIVQEFSARDW